MANNMEFARLMEARYIIMHERVLELLEYADNATVEKACILISRGRDFNDVKKRLANGELLNY